MLFKHKAVAIGYKESQWCEGISDCASVDDQPLNCISGDQGAKVRGDAKSAGEDAIGPVLRNQTARSQAPSLHR